MTATVAGGSLFLAARARKAKQRGPSASGPSAANCTSYVTADGTRVTVYKQGERLAAYIVSDMMGPDGTPGVDPGLVVNIDPEMQAVAYENMRAEIRERGVYKGDVNVILAGLQSIASSCDWSPFLAGRFAGSTTSSTIGGSPAEQVVVGVVDIAAIAAVKEGIV
jgi:hypothetical protein